MNHEARKYGRVTRSLIKRKNSREKIKVFTKNGVSLEEVHPRKNTLIMVEKTMKNRACSVCPEKQDFCQFTDYTELSHDQYQNLLMEQYGFDPLIPDALTQLNELRKALDCLSSPTVENSSQYVSPEAGQDLENVLVSPNGTAWQNAIEELDEYINDDKIAEDPVLDVQQSFDTPINICISQDPLVKVIAVKYCKYKNNNIELRRLVEKIVCVEYNIYGRDLEIPVQTMRAYFSLKPACSGKHEERTAECNPLSKIPSTIKHKFKISEEDLIQLNEKEIEIIDGKIAENQPYLNDLKKVLHRKQAIYKSKNKETLDLRSLYAMAKRSSPPLGVDFSNTNLLSKAVLMEVKEMILQRCTSARGIHRETIKRKEPGSEIESAISYITFMDVLQNK